MFLRVGILDNLQWDCGLLCFVVVVVFLNKRIRNLSRGHTETEYIYYFLKHNLEVKIKAGTKAKISTAAQNLLRSVE